MNIPPKWLRSKICNKVALTNIESKWLHKQVLITKSKEELVKIILEQENKLKEQQND